MSYIIYFLERFNRRTVRHFSESYIVFLLVSVSGNQYGNNHMGLGLTHPRIILWSKEFFSLNLKCVYNVVSFDVGELEGDVL